MKLTKYEKRNNADRDFLKLARTHLKRDWNYPLINYINKIQKKY